MIYDNFYVEFGLTSSLALILYNCIFAYWIPNTNSNSKHDQSAFPCVSMFHKYCVLISTERTDLCQSQAQQCVCYCAVHMEWAITSLFMPIALSFRPRKSAKTSYLYNNYARGDVK